MERIMGVLDIKLSKEEENVLLDALDIVKNLDTEIHEIKERDITTDHLNLISCRNMLTCILERFGSDNAKMETHEIMSDTTQDKIETSENTFDKVDEDVSMKENTMEQMLDASEKTAEDVLENTNTSDSMIEETSEDFTSEKMNENNIPLDEKKEETMEKEIVFPQTYEELVKQFETNEGCAAFARWAESKGSKDLYFANADGILLRNSNKQDGIGNDSNYVCLKFADMIGTGIYDDHHSYQFIVFTYSQTKGTSYEAYENIEYAIIGYKTALMEFCKKKFEAKFDKCLASYNNVSVAFANSATAEEMAGYYMATFPKERWNAFWEERNGHMSKRDRKTEKILKGLMD